MKLRKLLKRLDQLLGNGPDDSEERRQLLATLRKLKQKSADLRQQLAASDNTEDQQRLQEKLAIIDAHRRKAIRLLRQRNT